MLVSKLGGALPALSVEHNFRSVIEDEELEKYNRDRGIVFRSSHSKIVIERQIEKFAKIRRKLNQVSLAVRLFEVLFC